MISDKIMNKIKIKAKEEWPDDEIMQKYFIDDEIMAYKEFLKIDFKKVSDLEKEFILNKSKKFDKWEDIVVFIQDEIDALYSLNFFRCDFLTKEQIKKLKEEAKSEYNNSYREQLDYFILKVQQFENIRKTKKEIEPIKNILIDLENIIANECFNKNIQNYRSWGNLESVGRSFRYPIKFFDGKSEYKKRFVSKDIPSVELITGYYAFGANELHIYRALYKVLKYLEKNNGLKLVKEK